MSIDEQWRAIPAWEGLYEVSNLGRVRSLDRMCSDGRMRRGITLALVNGTAGYPQVGLHRAGTCVVRLVHILVLHAFEGPAPEGMEVRHLNGVRNDNRLSNLAWGTHLENMRDQREHGTHRNSVKTHCPSGHPYSGDNLWIEKSSGTRRCAECRREQWRRISARRTAARKAA